jgi:glycosyltransferase involved in cell wall biosynthesis
MALLCYVAYPNSLQLRSANAVQTHATLRELKRLAPETLALIPRVERGISAFDELGATHLPRIPIGRLSRLYRTTLLYYAERSAYALMVAAYLWWLHKQGRHYAVIYVREVISALWLSLLIPRLTGARVVYEVHDLETRNPSRAKERWVQPILGLIDKLTLTRPVALTSLTGAFRELLAHDGLREACDVAVLPDAYDSGRYFPRDRKAARRELGLPQDVPLIVYAGLTFAYRGVDLLLDAVARARDDEPALRVALVGGRPQEVTELQERARGLGLGGHAIFTGPQPQTRVPLYLAAGDILAVPDTVTDITASPLKLFEYMAMQRAVVCPDLPALREITGDDGALYFPRRDRDALAGAIVRLARDQGLREALANRAVECVAPYTYTRRAERLLAIARAVACGQTIGDL